MGSHEKTWQLKETRMKKIDKLRQMKRELGQHGQALSSVTRTTDVSNRNEKIERAKTPSTVKNKRQRSIFTGVLDQRRYGCQVGDAL